MALFVNDVVEGNLYELGLDGSNPTVRITPTATPYFPSYHAATNKFFFTEPAQLNLHSMNYDDTGQAAIKTVGAGLNDVSIDLVNSKVYYAVKDANDIRFCDFDGSNDASALTPTAPTRVRVDIAGGKCYWVIESPGRLYRDSIPGGGASELLVTDVGNIIEQFDLDLTNGKIYWSNSSDDLVRRCNLDGSSIETIVTSAVHVWGCAVDGLNGKVYYTEGTPKNVKRANLDGTSQEIIWAGSTFPGHLHLAADSAGGGRRTRWSPHIYPSGPGRSFGQSHHTYP